jgi:3-deoxy-D-manno-octulosonate 8-phosphate phosphatase (KDO 8-P phosphatase)
LITTVFLDIDGVLTDGAVYVDASGNETKRIIFDDIDAVFEMKRAGLKIGFLTGEDNEFCKYVQRRFSPDFFAAGCKDKLGACKKILEENNLDANSACFVGDSRKDIDLLKYLSLSFTPADVGRDVQESSKIILKTQRGQGVIREVANYILSGDNASLKK